MSVDSIWLVNTIAWLHREPIAVELMAFIATVALIVVEGLL